MTVRKFKRNEAVFRSHFTGLCLSVQCLTFAAVLAFSPGSVSAQADNDEDTVYSNQSLCEDTGGTYSESEFGYQCCHPNWGCMTCDIEFGDCLMYCDTQACCVRNNGCDSWVVPDVADLVEPDSDSNQLILSQIGAGAPLYVLDDGELSLAGTVTGLYHPNVSGAAEIFAAGAPDNEGSEDDEDFGSQIDAGTCGTGVAGSVQFGLLGFVGIVGVQRRRRSKRNS